MSRRLVIIGGGLTGGTAAVALREEGFDGEIALVTAEPHAPYERPPLSKSYLRGETPLDDALVRPDDYWRSQGVELRLGAVVASLDPAATTVELADGERLPYD